MYVRYVPEKDTGGTRHWARHYSINLNQPFKVVTEDEHSYVTEVPQDWAYRITPENLYLHKGHWVPVTVDKELEEYL